MRVVVVGFPRTATDLWDGKVDAELVPARLEERLGLVDLLLERLGREQQSADRPDSTRVGDCGHEIGMRDRVHARQHDGVLDAEQVRQRCADLCHRAELLFLQP